MTTFKCRRHCTLREMSIDPLVASILVYHFSLPGAAHGGQVARYLFKPDSAPNRQEPALLDKMSIQADLPLPWGTFSGPSRPRGSGAARTARFQVRAPLSKRLMSVLLLASMMAPSPGVDSGLKLRRVATGLLWIRASEACSNNRRRFVKIRTGGVARHFVGNGSSCVCDSRVR